MNMLVLLLALSSLVFVSWCDCDMECMRLCKKLDAGER